MKPLSSKVGVIEVVTFAPTMIHPGLATYLVRIDIPWRDLAVGHVECRPPLLRKFGNLEGLQRAIHDAACRVIREHLDTRERHG